MALCLQSSVSALPLPCHGFGASYFTSLMKWGSREHLPHRAAVSVKSDNLCEVRSCSTWYTTKFSNLGEHHHNSDFYLKASIQAKLGAAVGLCDSLTFIHSCLAHSFLYSAQAHQAPHWEARDLCHPQRSVPRRTQLLQYDECASTQWDRDKEWFK